MQILQRFSVTLASVIIAIFVCNSMYISTLKLQQISLITKSIDTYNSSNSRYLATKDRLGRDESPLRRLFIVSVRLFHRERTNVLT